MVSSESADARSGAPLKSFPGRRALAPAVFLVAFLLSDPPAEAHPPRVWVEMAPNTFLPQVQFTNGVEEAPWGVLGSDIRHLVHDDPEALAEAERAYRYRTHTKWAFIGQLSALVIGFIGGPVVATNTRNAAAGGAVFLGGMAVSIGCGIYTIRFQARALRSTYRAVNIYNGVHSAGVEAY